MFSFKTPRRRRLAITAAAIITTLAVFTIWPSLSRVVLVAFASILGAILLDAPVSWLQGRTGMPRWLALAGVLLASCGLFVGLGVVAGPRLLEQFSVLQRELPTGVEEIVTAIRELPGVSQMVELAPPPSEILSGSKLAGGVASMFASTLGGLAAGGLVLILAIFIAVRPQSYFEPALRLVPPPSRPRARRICAEVVSHLGSWLLARMLSMAVVAVLTGLGLWALGVPAPASLGLVAGLLSFIPNLGSLLGSLLGITFAFAISPMTALWAALIYAGVQMLEGNFITPLAERHAVNLPPAFLLCGQLLLGLLMGILGLLVATPLLVVGVILVRRLYVDEIEDDFVSDEVSPQPPTTTSTPASRADRRPASDGEPGGEAQHRPWRQAAAGQR